MTEVETLERKFRGQLVEGGDPAYEELRGVFNQRIDRRPRLIARCAGVSDVRAALGFARAHDLEIAVRGGARHVSGYATSEGGVVLDLSLMRGVRVDAGSETARIEGGALIRDVLIEAEPYGLAAVTGVVGHIGAGGLMLGGGIGWLGPRHGYGSDSITSLDVVLADGSLITVNAHQHPELYWAMRGAGPNYGVVTSMEVRLYPVPATVVGGDLIYEASKAPEVLRFLRELSAAATNDLYVFATYSILGEEATVPPSCRGNLALIVSVAHVGLSDAARDELAPLRRFAEPDADLIRETTYLDLHLEQESVYPSVRQYWQAEHVPELSDEVIDLTHQVAAGIDDLSIVVIYPWRGRMIGEFEGAGAFACRDSGWDVAAQSYWTATDRDQEFEDWADSLSLELRRRGIVETGVYPNMVSRLSQERLLEYYGDERFARLATIKAQYDPNNIFRLNANVPPAQPPMVG